MNIVPVRLTALDKYEDACRAVADCKTTSDVQNILDHAALLGLYARQAKNRELELDCIEIRERAERRLGELITAQKETVGLNAGAASGGKKDGSRGAYVEPRDERPTLAEAGIDKKLSARAQKLAAVPEPKFEASIAEWREKAAATGKHVHRTTFADDNEWFTPPEYIEMARQVMGGIDLDPATHKQAQRRIKATKFFTEKDDGLTREWHGRVWLNPPYARAIIEPFIDKLIAEYQSERVTEAILLTHNSSDTGWFQKAAKAASRTCFTCGRIRFIASRDASLSSPPQGQTFFYFGPRQDVFASVFFTTGVLMGACNEL